MLWETLADVTSWSRWNEDIEWTRIGGAAEQGKGFWLKPKGGPATRLTITVLQKPVEFTDVAHLLLAKMCTRHIFASTSGGVNITMIISVSGLLGFLWRRLVAEKEIAGAAAQIQRLIHASKK